jgi:ATP-dependent DNA helicase RecG
MHPEDLLARIAEGESETQEFKSAFGKEAIETLVAFANTGGGRLLIGVGNDGEIRGVRIGSEAIQQYVNQIKLATYPQIVPNVEIHEFSGKKVVLLQISEYPVKPVSVKNRYLKRVRNSNHPLSLDEIVDLQRQSLNISFDAYPAGDNLDDLAEEQIDQFLDRAGTTGRVPLADDRFTNLIKLKLIRDGKPTLAARLLFGTPDRAIHIGRFKSPDIVIDDRMISEPLTTALDEAMDFIRKNIRISFHFDGGLQRIERWQFPLEALRELLLNAVVHRDYRNSSDIVIKIFDHRIVFTSPGRIYGNLSVESLARDDYVSSIRNRLLADAFYLTGDIEKYGTGFIRIRKHLEAYPEIELKLREVGDFFQAELTSDPRWPDMDDASGKEASEPLPVGISRKLTDIQRSILMGIHENPGLTRDQLAETHRKSPTWIGRNLRMLQRMGLLRRIGPEKEGYWEVLV